MAVLELWRGLSRDFTWTLEDERGEPSDLSGYNAVLLGFDDAKGAVDKLIVECSIMQTGAGTEEDPFVRKGEIEFTVDGDDTAAWSGNAKIRAHFAARRISNSKWYPCQGPDACVVHDSVFDSGSLT